jgi:hypothetical protein
LLATLFFAGATAALTRIRFVVVHDPVSPATVNSIMDEGKAIKLVYERTPHQEILAGRQENI